MDFDCMESQAKRQQFIIYSLYIYIPLWGVFWPVFYTFYTVLCGLKASI